MRLIKRAAFFIIIGAVFPLETVAIGILLVVAFYIVFIPFYGGDAVLLILVNSLRIMTVLILPSVIAGIVFSLACTVVPSMYTEDGKRLGMALIAALIGLVICESSAILFSFPLNMRGNESVTLQYAMEILATILASRMIWKPYMTKLLA